MTDETPKEFTDCLEAQRAAYLAAPYPTLGERRADLEALRRLLAENEEAIIAAIDADFGCRPDVETRFLELFPVRDGARTTSRHLKKWMRMQRRAADWLLFPGARNRVLPQPLGVIGVIVPWNFPIQLSIGPLVDIFAAGNRAMVKMSENSVNLARLLAEISPRYLPRDKLTFFECGGRGPAFSSLPFDHLVFTGSGATGRAVMASAARNLCPVTLELGGKAPAVVAPDYPIKTAAERIIWAKCINAGQVCVNVDYLFLPEDKVDAFVEEARRLVSERYPDLNGPDYTTIINQGAYDRLRGMLDEARDRGATVIDLGRGQAPDASRRKLAPHIVLDATDDMAVMREEIFGPILPIRTYETPQDVIAYVNGRDRPLAFYPFSNDRTLTEHYITHILSGSVGINEAVVQVGQHDMPFGGVGESGMGHYHGHEGFLTFSKLRPIFRQGRMSSIQLAMLPPYGARARKALDWMYSLRA